MTDRPARSSGTNFDLLVVARAVSDAIERFATPLYAGVILAFLLVFVAAAGLFTVEADEAWILLSTMNAFGLSLPPTDALASPTLTSGGVHLLIQGALAWITSSIFVHRLVSLIFAVLLLTTVLRALTRMDRPTPIALAGTALFAAVPGLIFQAALATPEIIATSLLFWTCLYWVRRGQSSSLGAVISGVLFGISCATRVNCVIALPVILIFALFAGTGVRTRVFRTVLTIAVAAATLALAMAAYYVAARSGSGLEAQSFFLHSSGVEGAKPPTQLVWSFVIGDRIMPLWLIAAIVGALIISAAGAKESPAQVEPTRLSALFLLIGFASLAAWIAKAPIPHVRYLWPAVPCLWLAGVIQLTQPTIAKQRGYGALAFHLVVLAVCGSRIAADALIVANGESLTLVYQANGMSPFHLPRGSFHAGHDQRSVAAFVASQPSEARFYGLIPANSYPITLLSRRTVAPVQTVTLTGSRFILLNPADVTVWRPDSAFIQWLRASTRPALVSGDFAVFKIKDGAGIPPPPGMMRIGDNELVRDR